MASISLAHMAVLASDNAEPRREKGNKDGRCDGSLTSTTAIETMHKIVRREEAAMSPGQGDSEAGIVGVFSRAAATYDRIGPQVFAHFGQRLVERAQLARGAAVLDIAAGRGAVLFPAARQVGPGGRVIGIDLSGAMVRETAADIRGTGWRHIEIQQMDAEHLDFPDGSFDLVLCGFALWFFPHPEQALHEFFRVLKPGGRVGLTTWTEDCPFLAWYDRELASSMPQSAPPVARRGQGFRVDTPERLEAPLQQTGFVDIDITAEATDFIYADDEEWWLSLWSSGTRRRLERLEPPTLEQVKSEMLHKVQALKQADGIHTLWRALLPFAQKPLQ
jgi:O-methyltransferase/aklanonic acid methyltransferase